MKKFLKLVEEKKKRWVDRTRKLKEQKNAQISRSSFDFDSDEKEYIASLLRKDKPKELPRPINVYCPECHREIQPRYTENYLGTDREYELKGGIRPDTELECPLCNAILPCEPIKYTPDRGPVPTHKRIWERTMGWFRKFLP